MILESIIVVMLFSLSVWYLAKPWWETDKQPSVSTDSYVRSDLLLRKEEVLATLSDLKLDRDMKKISEEEFRDVFDASVAEGAEILKRIDSLPGKGKG